MRIVAAALLLFVGIPSGITAADNQFSVRVEANVGFGGLFKPGRWSPVELTVQNLGPDIFGRLRIELERRARFGPDRYSNVYEQDLDLAAGSVKSFSLVLPLETGVYPIEVTIDHHGQEVVTQQVELAGRGASGALVAVLSRRTSLDFLLPVFNSQGQRALDVVYPLIDYLPEQWHGYDGLDLLVVHDARLQDLSGRQIEAIREWVSAGGHLVVSAGAHLSAAERDAVSMLTGLEPVGLNVTRVGDVGIDTAGLPVTAAEEGEPVVVSVFPGGEQAVVVQRFGRGRMVLLPFDFAQLVRVAPATSLGLWLSLLPEQAILTAGGPRTGMVPISLNRRAFETDVLANQLDLPLYQFPSAFLLIGLLGSFVAIVTALLLWIEHRKRPIHAGLGAALLVVVAVATSVLGHMTLTIGQQQPQALALTLEIAEMGLDDGYAVASKDIVLFSRQRADYEIQFTASPVLVPMDSRNHQVAVDSVSRILTLPAGRWSHVNTHLVQISEMDVRARIQRGPGYANVEISNRSASTLDGVVVLSGGFPNEVGRILPGDTIEAVVMGSAVGRWDEIDWLNAVPPGDLSDHRAQLLRDLARRQRSGENSGLSIVGWTAKSLIDEQITPSFERQVDLSVLVINEPPREMEPES